MPNIGNDVVDLISPPNVQKSMDSRFLKKILTDTEIEQVRGADDPDAALWSFWACKEAAYKVIKKQTSDTAFVPRRWSVFFQHSFVDRCHGQEEADAEHIDQQAEFVAGAVHIPDRDIIQVRLFSSSSWIHCIAADSPDGLNAIHWRVALLPEPPVGLERDPSGFARLSLIRSLAGFLREDDQHIDIRRQKKEGDLLPPVVYLKDVQTDIDVSLSHDGQWVAYAFVCKVLISNI